MQYHVLVMRHVLFRCVSHSHNRVGELTSHFTLEAVTLPLQTLGSLGRRRRRTWMRTDLSQSKLSTSQRPFCTDEVDGLELLLTNVAVFAFLVTGQV